MERKYKLCPRCELNYIPVTENYCDICKGGAGSGRAELPSSR